ncbi:hypothetical protein Pflav_042840 [Phytohabitans flavus]|uniref:DUF7948 domain-containing protein n=1 Tax=Phytohabitans flavus TaxID=1076124 RepID=A0A6F8XVK6_9ACTN|nr:SBBP repeat-containing protein [Phytohabitans flavus]BCB77874.1 hypothetical protein Pflav_042840 [Phytohabitans flavus]
MAVVLGALAALISATVLVQAGARFGAGPGQEVTARAESAQGAEQVGDAYARLPLTFVENRGQADGQVRYLAHGSRYGFYFTPDSLAISLLERDSKTGVNLFLDFVGANPDVSVAAADRAASTVSYLQADLPSGSRSGLPTYGEVLYRQLWPGVDMAVTGKDGVLKYEFHVAPGARIDEIQLAYRGAGGLTTDGTGALLVDTPLGVLRDTPPVSYQVIGGQRVPVGSRYKVAGDSYGFAVDGHDPAHGLVIDPGLEYSTYLGGFGNQTGAAIAVDASGSAYVTGYTQSPTFPTTPGAFDRTGSASNDLDAFVSKLNPSGTALVYSTFLGGSNFDQGRDLAVDAAGNAYVAGQTRSSTFPTTSNAYDRTFNVDTCPRCGIDQYDAFVAKVNPTGSGLVYSTFLGGFDIDDILAIALDGSGQAYVAGQTASSNFPTTSGAFDTTANGEYDGFVAKFNASGSQLVYSTRLGGTDNELPSAIAVDAAGNAVVGGSTRSAGFPTTPGTLQPVHAGGAFIDLFDGFVTKVDPTGSALVWSTFLGGDKPESVSEVILDASGNTYILGGTQSPTFPTTPGTFDTTFDGTSQSFAAKLDPSASTLLYSTFLGKASGGSGALTEDGSLWFAGGGAPDAFVSPDAWDPQFSGGASDAYVAKLNPAATALDYASFLGGTDSDGAFDVALDPAGNVYLSGRTFSADFPTTAGAFDRVYSGDSFILGSEAWIAKLAVGPNAPTPPPSPPAIPTAPELASPADAASVAQPVAFDWNDVDNAASYTIQVDEISAFGEPLILSANVTASAFTAGSLPTGNWFWRVRAVNSAGTPGPWSTFRRITVQAPPTPSPSPTPTANPTQPLPAPALVSPASDARIRPGTAVTFDWGDVSGAASYTIQVDNSQTFQAPFTVESTTATSQYVANGLPTQRMWWRVRANNSDGTPGPGPRHAGSR